MRAQTSWRYAMRQICPLRALALTRGVILIVLALPAGPGFPAPEKKEYTRADAERMIRAAE